MGATGGGCGGDRGATGGGCGGDKLPHDAPHAPYPAVLTPSDIEPCPGPASRDVQAKMDVEAQGNEVSNMEDALLSHIDCLSAEIDLVQEEP